VTTVIATLVHGALFAVSVIKLAQREVPNEAATAAEAQPQATQVASGMESDPASGPNRMPIPTAVDAQSLLEQTLIAVDVAPPGSASGPDEAFDETFLAALSTAGAQIDPVAPASSPVNRAHKSAQGAHANGGSGGFRSRRARLPKQEDSTRKAEPVDIDLGQSGGVDALLYGEGSPGLPHDLSSPPRIGGYVYWECPWPEAAAQANVNRAVVHVTVDVTARGKAKAVQLIDQPGYEFGDDAIRCAMDQRYIPGRDTEGRPVAGRTRKFSVQFSRSLASRSP
jgi:hypothetical protein